MLMFVDERLFRPRKETRFMPDWYCTTDANECLPREYRQIKTAVSLSIRGLLAHYGIACTRRAQALSSWSVIGLFGDGPHTC
jgi:hypothetical protein